MTAKKTSCITNVIRSYSFYINDDGVDHVRISDSVRGHVHVFGCWVLEVNDILFKSRAVITVIV